jgi:hypothetical protein
VRNVCHLVLHDRADAMVEKTVRSDRTSQRIEPPEPFINLVPTDERLAHHVSRGSTWFHRVVLRHSGFSLRLPGGSIEPISVERNSFREEQLLQPLLAIERCLHPEV